MRHSGVQVESKRETPAWCCRVYALTMLNSAAVLGPQVLMFAVDETLAPDHRSRRTRGRALRLG